MTNFYVQFTEDGKQAAVRYGLDPENTEGWFDTGLTDINDKRFKLVNNQVVELTDADKAEELRQLRFETAHINARIQRNTLLINCDWTQAPDNALSAEERQAWATYRQALRDLPDTIAQDGTFTLPTPPDPNYDPLRTV